MIIATAISKNGVRIRLTLERWKHAIATHQEIDQEDFPRFMKVISAPEFILKGSKSELLAIQKIPRKKLWIVVPYKEVSNQSRWFCDNSLLYKRFILVT